MLLIMEVMNRHIPKAKASQKVKRGQIKNLIALRSKYTEQKSQAITARIQ